MGARRRSLARAMSWPLQACEAPRGGGERLRARRRDGYPCVNGQGPGPLSPSPATRAARGKPRKGGGNRNETSSIPPGGRRRPRGPAAVAEPAIAQSMPEVKWRLTSGFPKSLDTIYGAAETLRQVRRRGDGRQVPDPALRGGRDRRHASRRSTRSATAPSRWRHTASYYYVGKDPTFAFGTAVPFGLNARQHERLDVSRRRHGADERVLRQAQRLRHARRQHRHARWAAGSARR